MFALNFFGALLAIFIFFGCASQTDGVTTKMVASIPASEVGTSFAVRPELTGMDYFGSSGDQGRLQTLWAARTEATPFSDFPIGPGDEIVVIVPAIASLSDINVRVSVDGDINLPMLGQIHAAGLTESEIREVLKSRLSKYMYDPQFQFVVRQYQSRQVAVLGSVTKPGVYTLTGPYETILELISIAGGPSDGASDRVVLIPAASRLVPFPNSADSRNPAAHYDVDSDLDAKMSSSPDDAQQTRVAQTTFAPMLPLPKITTFTGLNASPIVVALHSNSTTGSERYLNMPLRPGDVVVVPSGGMVAVTGWVYSPGSFKVAPGASVLSSIGAAGGPLYAADQEDVRLLRTATNGTTESIPIDLKKIKSGEQRDLPVQGNDVIEVSYSNSKIVPYIFYQILNSKVGGVGIAAPIP